MTQPFDDRLQRLTRDLATELTSQQAEGLIERRQGVVTAVNANGTVDISLGGAPIPGVRYKKWYRPIIGDVVFIDFVDSDVVVDGPLANNTGQSDQHTILTSESTGSGSFVDLATVGPTVSIRTGDIVKVTLSAQIVGSGGIPIMGFDISGATTRAPSDTEALIIGSGVTLQASRVMRIAVTSGLNTFIAKYRTTSGTGTFERRNLLVETLA